MTFEMTDKQADTIGLLVPLGYKLTNFYEDGIVRMARINGVTVFVRKDGTCSRPMTHATMVADAELHEAGISVDKSGN